MPKSFIRSRSLAFARQGGNCFYCDLPMWTKCADAFASAHRITVAQAKQFQCTGEHLVALQDGGTNSESNVVAACRFCNVHRHHRRPAHAPSPWDYKQQVQRQMTKGRWFGARVLKTPIEPAVRNR
jgi:5-methylcytosine-specific restriction endonuclease McrA